MFYVFLITFLFSLITNIFLFKKTIQLQTKISEIDFDNFIHKINTELDNISDSIPNSNNTPDRILQ